MAAPGARARAGRLLAADAIRLAGRVQAGMARRGPAPPAIGGTPREAVFRAGKATLFRYLPRAAADPSLDPVLIVYGLVGRHTMTDLGPDRSLVSALLDRGADVYLVDWGGVGRADRWMALDDFIDGYLHDCVGALTARAGRPPALLGVCEGGVFSLIYAALHPRALARLCLTITPVDFHADLADGPEGWLNRWVRAMPVGEIDALIDAFGNLPGGLLGAGFQTMTPRRTIRSYAVDLPAAAADPAALEQFLRVEAWLADRPDHPGAAARQWLVDLYKENRLVEGRLTISGRRVDLSNVARPVLNVYGLRDHIIPPACVRALRRHAPPALYRELPLPTGHAGVIVGATGLAALPPAITAWMRENG